MDAVLRLNRQSMTFLGFPHKNLRGLKRNILIDLYFVDHFSHFLIILLL